MFSCQSSMNPRSAAALKVLRQAFANFQRAFWRIVSLWRTTCAKDSVVRWPAALLVWQEPRISRHSGWPSPHVFPPYIPGCAPFFRMQVASGVVLAFPEDLKYGLFARIWVRMLSDRLHVRYLLSECVLHAFLALFDWFPVNSDKLGTHSLDLSRCVTVFSDNAHGPRFK